MCQPETGSPSDLLICSEWQVLKSGTMCQVINHNLNLHYFYFGVQEQDGISSLKMCSMASACQLQQEDNFGSFNHQDHIASPALDKKANQCVDQNLKKTQCISRGKHTKLYIIMMYDAIDCVNPIYRTFNCGTDQCSICFRFR